MIRFNKTKVFLWNKINTAEFSLSFGNAIMKIYPFTTLSWMNEDENM